MLRRTSVILGAALLAATASLAEAQEQKGQRGQRPGGQGGPGAFGASVTSLLAMAEVQKELAVTPEQKGLIEELVKDIGAAGRGAGGGGNRQELQNLSPEERQKRVAEFVKQSEERAKKAEDSVKLILEPKQFDRLIQLRLQREGVGALVRNDVAEKLSLTQDQKEKIGKIRESARGEGGGGNRENASQEDRKKAATEAGERREKANTAILAVLTSQQKETWDKMQGKKFDFPQPQGRGRPGGGN